MSDSLTLRDPVLVLATVGTQDFQGDPELADAVVAELGSGAKVDARLVAAVLDDLSTEELVARFAVTGLIRNAPCFRLLDEQATSWTLALLATDQPPPPATDERFRRGDTIGLARVLSRVVTAYHRPDRVLTPFALHLPPHDPTPELAAEVEAAVREAFEQWGRKPGTVVVLPIGGTPALRSLMERAAGLIAENPIAMSPQAGRVVHHTLNQLLILDRLRRDVRDQLAAAARAGRYSAALEVARLADKRLGMAEMARVVKAAELAEKMVNLERPARPDGGSVIAAELRGLVDQRRELGDSGFDVLVRAAAVRRAERDRRWGEALTRWVTAAELLPRLWQLRHMPGLRTDRFVDEMACEVQSRRVPAPGPAQAKRGIADIARSLAMCRRYRDQRLRCGPCPLRADDLAALETGPGAHAASALRDADFPQERAGRLRDLRNRWVHGEEGLRMETVERGVKGEQRILRSLGLPIRGAGMAGLLASVYEEVTGRHADDPLTVLDGVIAGSASIAEGPGAPDGPGEHPRA